MHSASNSNTRSNDVLSVDEKHSLELLYDVLKGLTSECSCARQAVDQGSDQVQGNISIKF